MPPAADAAKENKVKSTKNSGDSGNCSEAEEEQNTNRATTLEFQLTQSLLSQVRADKNNADANSGKQAYKDLPRMNFIINGKTISKDFVGQLCDRYNQELQSNKRQVAKHVLIEMFKHAKAEVPDDHILKELITNCNQAGYDGSLFMQLFPIFFEHNLQLSDANDRKISIICNSQDSLNIQYCPSMPVKQQDTNIEICRLDAILEFTLKSQNGKVEYEEGKVTLTIPEQLKTGRESLLDDINKYFKGADNAVVAGSPAEVDSDVDNSFDIIPKSLAFDELVDSINKAKNGDYTDLDEVINNIREDKKNDRFIADLNRGNFKSFCSQQLNLTKPMYTVLSNYKKGNYNNTVKELVLLAIAANDTLVEKCAKMHEGILFTQDEDLDRLLLGAGGQGYIKALLEFLEEKQSRVLSWNNICEKLKRASSIGNQECVEAILNRFEDTESRDPAISSKLLHYAVEKGDYDLVNSLIKNDANVNIQDRNNKTALHYAVSSYGDIQNVNKMVMLLVESGAKIDTQDSDGKTALHYAAASNKDEIVRLLLKEGANEEIKDKSGKTFLDMVASGTKSFLLNVLHPGGLLHHAAKEGNIDRAKRLLAKGKDVNAKNSHRESPLSVAIQNNRLKIVKLFLEERAKIGKEEVNKAIGAGNLEVIELLVSKDAVITEKAIQYARGVYEKCEEDKKQAHSSVLTFLVDIHNEQLFKKAIEQGDLKKIKSYVEKGTVISGEIIQCARDACKICREDKKQAHLSVLTFLMKTSKDQFKEAIKLGNLERVKLFVEKGAVITEKIIQYVQNAYEKYKEGRVCISQYPDGMKAEERNRTEILNFLKDNVRSNSNLVNETATSSQVVNEEDNNQSENPGLESAGSKQPQENVDKGKNIMNNEEASIEEAIGNNYRRGKMSKNKKSIKQGLFIDVIYDVKRMKNFLESNDDKLVLKKALNQVNTELTKKENTRGLDLAKKNIRINQKKRLTEAKELLTEKISNIEMNAKTAASSVNDVSATTSSQAAPVSEDVSQDIRSEILVPSSSVSPDVGNVSTAENINDNMVASENSGQVNDVQSGDEQPDSPPLSPQSSASGDVEDTEASANAAVTIPKKVDSLVSDKDVTDGSDNEFVKVSPPPEDNTHSPQSIRVRDSFGYTPLKVAHERNITVKTRNAQNLQSAVLSSQQLASLNVIEIFNKHGREDFTPLKLTVQEFLNN
ncbi:ankyrin repeat domain-containing protein [Wolbachia endosymbiont (group A) of Sphecodes monilicornis]|uniref:ankyrin repeat domain-containing protein n=3 Tax=unclassified Wolbachia TaxID=2640676 RepID=UPI002225E209|nr:ankyrin repeat domain-containing protein [Wolbachia endosymbiont (group A) of Sphecodes monilicornis]